MFLLLILKSHFIWILAFFFPSFSSLMASVNLVKSCSMFPENSSGISLFQSSDYKSLTFIMNISAA